MKTIGWLLPLLCCACNMPSPDPAGKVNAWYATHPPQLDGKGEDTCWQEATIYPIDQLWSGKLPYASDYMGRFRVCWDRTHVYALVEILDDSLLPLNDRIDLYIGSEGTGKEPVLYSIFPSEKAVIATMTDTLAPTTEGVVNKVQTANHLTRWEIAIAYPSMPGDKAIPFAIGYHDQDRPNAAADRMGNIPLAPDPKKSKNVIYPDDLGELHLVLPARK